MLIAKFRHKYESRFPRCLLNNYLVLRDIPRFGFAKVSPPHAILRAKNPLGIGFESTDVDESHLNFEYPLHVVPDGSFSIKPGLYRSGRVLILQI